MYEQILPWVGLGVLLLLCLPVPSIQKCVLEVSAWSLRLAMVGLLAAGVYLWFRPGDLPAGMSAALAESPRLLSLLPDQGSPAFALCAACWVVTALVPVLAILDVTRKLAGLGRVRVLTTAPQPLPTRTEPEPLPDAVEIGVPVLRPIERRTAAAAIASAGTRHTR